jgi:hypothetical protein
MVIHGVPGVGKSTFGSTMPSPVFIQCEDGLSGIHGNAFPLVRDFDDFADQVGAVFKSNGEFKTLVLDTVDALERMVWQKVCVDNNVKNIEDIGYGKGYTYAMGYWQQILGMLNKVRNKGMHVCVLCHTKVARFQSPIVESYDLYDLALHKNARALLIEWCDILGFANWQVITRSEDAGFNKTVSKGVGTGQRKLHLVERPAWQAKNRYSLPDDTDFSWPVLEGLINAFENTTQENAA